jgi:GNAT superfamily N-acetyltransferase
MNLQIRECSRREFSPLIARIDQEFVFSKGRTVSLSRRFPHTLDPARLAQVRVALSDGKISGALAVRLFDWVAGDCAWRGAMVGMVWVDPLQRRKGIGSALLSATTEYLEEKKVDVGVLWTGSPTIYERAGWFVHDVGLFGESLAPYPVMGAADVKCRLLDAADTDRYEALRAHLLPMRVPRTVSDYRTVPIPAEHVWSFSHTGRTGAGFALVGELNGTGFFYEMVAPPELWMDFWGATTQRFDRLLVNGSMMDPTSLWLGENRLVAWQPQHKTMWRRLSSRFAKVSIDCWHIPYFDWI